jgi:hypothetical protein
MHTYCVVLRPQHSLKSLYPRTKRYYLRAKSALLRQCLSRQPTIS